MTSTQALYELQGISRAFGEHREHVDVLTGVTLTLPQNRLISICGPSGAGKSTLLHVLGLLDRGYTGSLKLNGEDLSGLSEHAATRYRLERIGIVFQRYHVLEAMTVLENVAWPYWRLHRDRRSAFVRAGELLDQLGLRERAHHRPAKLSGGEMQRVAFARALVNRPAVVLADEPTAQLDEANAMHIIDVLRELRQKGNSIVVVTHDPKLSSSADFTISMNYGRITSKTEVEHAL